MPDDLSGMMWRFEQALARHREERHNVAEQLGATIVDLEEWPPAHCMGGGLLSGDLPKAVATWRKR